VILSRIGALDVYTFGIYNAHPEVTCIASTRSGGVSREAFAAFNLGLRCGDDPEHVHENRARLARALGVGPERLTAGRQVHGATIATVTAKVVGSGGMNPDSAIPGTDGLVTNVPDVPLLVLVADCAAIFLYDPVRKAIGIAHGGWRGTAAGVAGAAVARMAEAFGSRPAEMAAAIGPSIGPCCYEVGADVVERFHGDQPDVARHVFSDSAGLPAAKAGKKRLDLWVANRRILMRAGLDPDKIEIGGLCTACHPDRFYSHRASRGHTGRSAGVIVLHERSRRG
jgi:YfiH family protein